MNSYEEWLARYIDTGQVARLEENDEIFSSYGLRYLKALCEICYFLYNSGEHVTVEFKRKILNHVSSIVNSTNFWHSMRFNKRFNTLFLYLLDIAIKAKLIDYESKKNCIQKLISIYSTSGPERVPYRYVDIQYCILNVINEESSRFYSTALSVGCIRDTDTIQDIDTEDLYALTHYIFYLTDFGRRRSDYINQHKFAIVSKLRTLADYSAVVGNLDTLAEVILCLKYIDSPNDISHDYIQLIKREQNEDGSWDGPCDTTKDLLRAGVPEDKIKFYNNYHTTILCAQAIYSKEPKKKKKTSELLLGSVNRAHQRKALGTESSPSYARFSPELPNIDDSVVSGEVIYLLNHCYGMYGTLYKEVEKAIHEFCNQVNYSEGNNIGFDYLFSIYSDTINTGEEAKSEIALSEIRAVKTEQEYYKYVHQIISLSKHERIKALDRSLGYFSYTQKYGITIRLLCHRILAGDLDKTTKKYYLRQVDTLFDSYGNYLWKPEIENERGWYMGGAVLGTALLKHSN